MIRIVKGKNKNIKVRVPTQNEELGSHLTTGSIRFDKILDMNEQGSVSLEVDDMKKDVLYTHPAPKYTGPINNPASS